MIGFCQCAGITHCITAKVSNRRPQKRFTGLLCVNQRKVLEVYVVILAGSEWVKGNATKTNWKRCSLIPGPLTCNFHHSP